jgi:FMN phosphatase YigB (HAD superfamily)
LQKYFTKVYISEDIKAPKPSQKIFEHAIKSSNAKKETSLMIGDDFQTDIVGALRFGIDTVWLDSAASIQNINKLKATISNNVFTVRSIRELKQFV